MGPDSQPCFTPPRTEQNRTEQNRTECDDERRPDGCVCCYLLQPTPLHTVHLLTIAAQNRRPRVGGWAKYMYVPPTDRIGPRTMASASYKWRVGKMEKGYQVLTALSQESTSLIRHSRSFHSPRAYCSDRAFDRAAHHDSLSYSGAAAAERRHADMRATSARSDRA